MALEFIRSYYLLFQVEKFRILVYCDPSMNIKYKKIYIQNESGRVREHNATEHSIPDEQQPCERVDDDQAWRHDGRVLCCVVLCCVVLCCGVFCCVLLCCVVLCCVALRCVVLS